MGVKVVLYILAFIMVVGAVVLIERRDTQAGAEAKADVLKLRAEVAELRQKVEKLDGVLDRVSMAEQMMGTLASKSDEMYRIAESKIKEIEYLAHSAKLDAMRRPQKIEIDIPPIRVVTGPRMVKKPVVKAAPPPDATVIKDIKKKLKDLSQ